MYSVVHKLFTKAMSDITIGNIYVHA